MDAYLMVNNDGSINGFFLYQPEGYHFPLVHIDEKIADDFEHNWMFYSYQNDQLVEPVSNDDLRNNDTKISKRLDTMQTQQAFISQQMFDIQNELKELKTKVGA